MTATAPPSPDARCRALAGRQRQLLTYRQALECGLTSSAMSRRVSGGHWRRVLPKVYWLGHGELSWETKALALVLWSGGVVSGEAAAALWGIGGFCRGVFVVTTSRVLRSPAPDVRIRRASLARRDLGTVEGIAVTSPARTLVDLAAEHSEEAVEIAMDDALTRGLVSASQLRWFVNVHAGKGPSGTKALRRLLARRESVAATESVLERKVERLIAGSRLPPPRRQHVVRDGRRFVARVDFAYPDARVALEVDGYRWHSGRAAWARDLERRNRLTELGWRVIHVTHADTSYPERVVDRLRGLLS